MQKKKTPLLYDGEHFRVNIPSRIIKEKGWRKGDPLLLKENNGTIMIQNSRSKHSRPTIYSIGYEGKTIKEFISLLNVADVQQLIDIRENPFSYKKGFSKKPLQQKLREAGINYHHIKELGTEKRSRDEYKMTGDVSRLCKTFSIKLERSQDQYNILSSLATFRRSAIMCFEDDYQVCHRQVIEKRLKRDGFEIIHLSLEQHSGRR